MIYKDDNYTPEDLENVEEGVMCPVCGAVIQNNPADQLWEIDYIDSDMRIHSLQDDILDDWLIMCPTCYYVDHNFKIPLLKPNEIRTFVGSDKYLTLFPDNNPTTKELFSVYLILQTIQGQNPYILADIHNRLAWLYDDENDKKRADVHRARAAEQYELSLSGNTDLDEKHINLTWYLIANLNRRQGKFTDASRALYNLVTEDSVIQELYDFQAGLIRNKDNSAQALPRKEAANAFNT